VGAWELAAYRTMLAVHVGRFVLQLNDVAGIDSGLGDDHIFTGQVRLTTTRGWRSVANRSKTPGRRCTRTWRPSYAFCRRARDAGIIDLDRDAEIRRGREESKYDLKRTSPTTRKRTAPCTRNTMKSVDE
jgi:hypothetical protein